MALEAVVPFAPAPHLLPAEVRDVLTPVDRGTHGPGWLVRDGVQADRETLAKWDSLRARFELAFPIGDRWQLDQVLELSRQDPKLVHLHDLADDLNEGAYATGPVLADIPSAVAAETLETIALLAALIDSAPAAGCRVTDLDGRDAWHGAALTSDVALCETSDLLLTRRGQLQLADIGPLEAWQTTPEVVTATVVGSDGVSQVQLDAASSACLRRISPDGAAKVASCPASHATSTSVSGLAAALGDAVRFQRSVLIQRATG